MEHFLNGKISEGTLKIEFLKIQESHEQVQQVLESNLIILSPNPNSDYIADLMDNCKPWSNHLKGDGYDQINLALKKDNYKKARAAIDEYATETADPACITVLKMALVEVCTKCTTLIKEALPANIVVP